MEKLTTTNQRYVTIAWGLGLLLIGSLCLIPGDQLMIAMLGLGIILLGLNLARYYKCIQVSFFSITLGVIALGVATWLLLRPVYWLGIELQLFPILLIILGLYLLIPAPRGVKGARCC